VLVLGLLVNSEFSQQSVQEVVKHDGVSAPFRYLRCHHTVLGKSCYHGE
jgi:hypothetical protein